MMQLYELQVYQFLIGYHILAMYWFTGAFDPHSNLRECTRST